MDATVLARELIEPIPANALLGVKVCSAVDASATVELHADTRLGNVIGSLHASGLIALIDAAGLAAIIASAEDANQLRDVSPLGSDADLTFFAPARGRLQAQCTLDEQAQASIRQLLDGDSDRAALLTEAQIIDESLAVVCTGRFRWRVRRMEPVPVA